MGKNPNKSVKQIAGVSPAQLKVEYSHNVRYLKHIEHCLEAIKDASSTFVPTEDTDTNKSHFVEAVMLKCPTIKSPSTARDVLRGTVKSGDVLHLSKDIRCMLAQCYPTDRKRLMKEQEAAKA